MTGTASPPSDVDILAGRLPEAPADLAGLTGTWHLWRDWADGMWPAMARHLDGTPGDPDARWLAVVPYAFTWAIIVGTYRSAQCWHDDRWCYKNRLAATAAAQVWDGHGEPVGWHRHPGTDRRTLDGDMTRIFTEGHGCPQCGAWLHEHRCHHRPACCPGRCPEPAAQN